MSVKLRMTRIGRRHRPFFRINAVESRHPRDGKVVEKLGHYDPIEKDESKQVVLNLERVKYWLDKGAIPSDTVSKILLRLGIKHKYAEETTARRARARAIARAKGVPFTKAERTAAGKQPAAPEEKAETETKAKPAAVEKAAKAEPQAQEQQSKKEEKPAQAKETEKGDEN